jgi:peptidyl-prolyl cis-trans isomerase C
MLSGCATKEQPVLARVDDRVVTPAEFNDRLERLPEQFRDIIKKNKERYLDDFVIELLFYREALRRGIDKQKDTKEVLKEARRKIVMAKYVEQEINNKIDVNEEEVRDYYEKNIKKFVTPEALRASHILVKTEEEAGEVLAQLTEGADFAELAKTKSIDITNRRGGDIGYFTQGQLVPEFEEACLKLEVGQLSPVVKTSFGFHIVKLTDKKPAATKPFEEVKEQITKELRSQKRKEHFDRTVERLKNKATIEINYDLFKEKKTDE